MAAEEDAGQRANDERTQQYPSDRSQKPVADARDQGQRHGMGDVGADETGDRGARVEQNESRHPDGAGTDRGASRISRAGARRRSSVSRSTADPAPHAASRSADGATDARVLSPLLLLGHADAEQAGPSRPPHTRQTHP